MHLKGLYSMKDFLMFKNSKDVSFKIVGDINNISKFESEITSKYNKNAVVSVSKKEAILKTKDRIIEDIKSIASYYGLTLVFIDNSEK